MRAAIGLAAIGLGIGLVWSGATDRSFIDELQAVIVAGGPSGPTLEPETAEGTAELLRIMEECGVDLNSAQAIMRGIAECDAT